MPDASVFAEAYEAGSQEITGRDSRLSDFSPGSNLDALVALAGRGVEILEVAIASRFLASYFAHAAGADLDTLALDHLGETRNAAAKATVVLSLARAGTGAGNVAIAAGQRFETDPDAGLDEDVVFEAVAPQVMTGTSLSVTVRALLAGTAGNVRAGTITRATPALSDPTVTITNAAAAADGANVETDDAFRARLLEILRTLARGTVAALIAGAKTVDGVAAAAVDESDAGPNDGGIVKLYVGDVNGNASGALVAAVVVELYNWRAAGVAVSVLAGTREEVPAIVVRVRMRANGFDSGWIGSVVKAAVEAVGDGLAPDEKLYQEPIDSAAWTALGGSRDVLDVASERYLPPNPSPQPWPIVPTAGRSLRIPAANVAVVVMGPGA